MTKKTALIATVVIAVAYATLTFARGTVERPAASEFGTGPRASEQGIYSAALQQADSLKPRKMYTIQVRVTDAAGQPVDDAQVTIDGGMPQHGHGLPTRPRVTANLGNGVYEISGLRFNMGGWWVLKLSVAAPPGNDTITFNLSL